jgi:hypothetical protein
MSEKISQTTRLYDLLSDGNPHSTNEIQLVIYGREHLGYANIHGRITDIRKKYGLRVINFKDDEVKSLSYYQIVNDDKVELREEYKNSILVKRSANGIDLPIPLEEMPEYDKFNLGQQILM